jgi:hypothetical protein
MKDLRNHEKKSTKLCQCRQPFLLPEARLLSKRPGLFLGDHSFLLRLGLCFECQRKPYHFLHSGTAVSKPAVTPADVHWGELPEPRWHLGENFSVSRFPTPSAAEWCFLQKKTRANHGSLSYWCWSWNNIKLLKRCINVLSPRRHRVES